MIDELKQTSPWQLCVAPMIDVTDRHCRYFHRLLAPKARLYTEMITTSALQFGDISRHLDFDRAEHPVALQLGGSDPVALAHCAKLGEKWDFDEINLNCGCPSERVQKGDFGARLMLQPKLLADAVKAMQDAVSIPVTVKHRLGLDYDESIDLVTDFVGSLYDVGCRVFIAHARNAVLAGLSPRDNREVPPLRYKDAAHIKTQFPEATIVLNGGLIDVPGCQQALQTFDGVMLGRAAWHNPGCLSDLSVALSHVPIVPDADQVIQDFAHYCEVQIKQGVPLRVLVRPLLGWMQGIPGSRFWRRSLSDQKTLSCEDVNVLIAAWENLKNYQNPSTKEVA
jgi:tRNA-dihydrouridine synthase A